MYKPHIDNEKKAMYDALIFTIDKEEDPMFQHVLRDFLIKIESSLGIMQEIWDLNKICYMAHLLLPFLKCDTFDQRDIMPFMKLLGVAIFTIHHSSLTSMQRIIYETFIHNKEWHNNSYYSRQCDVSSIEEDICNNISNTCVFFFFSK